ncbi:MULTISPECIES: hypothetical protein [Prevotellaceae]|uniref:Uncharacterized protein n=1 Tax=Xylanibacter brevis TaxID=83231 RepID=A0ABS9CEN1_9BACT|nr:MULTISPECIES: hypothetical protein [Prevotellaceae]MBS7319150.1 hypothetical protein [Prevotella sp.]MCF2563315.1 hypothetical protein [Xylanibacter brevis]MCI7001370.1 hypothetical protein [Prevotella sp.]MDD7172563.1 hypothetical protein [Prevotella sp.]MDY4683892.1 hypothetical protein [Prevotella sp.]
MTFFVARHIPMQAKYIQNDQSIPHLPIHRGKGRQAALSPTYNPNPSIGQVDMINIMQKYQRRKR